MDEDGTKNRTSPHGQRSDDRNLMNLGHRSLTCLDNRNSAQLRQLHEAGIALAHGVNMVLGGLGGRLQQSRVPPHVQLRRMPGFPARSLLTRWVGEWTISRKRVPSQLAGWVGNARSELLKGAPSGVPKPAAAKAAQLAEGRSEVRRTKRPIFCHRSPSYESPKSATYTPSPAKTPANSDVKPPKPPTKPTSHLASIP